MTGSELNCLRSDLQANSALVEELCRRGGDPDAMVRLAASKGYGLTRQDAEELIHSFDELSDDELERAVGGAWNDPPPSSGG